MGAGLYPLLLPPLETALVVNPVMTGTVIAYNVYIHRVFRGAVPAGPGEHGY